MDSINIARIQQLDRLIRTKSTGNVKALSSKMRISERAVFYYINTIKKLGAPVKFSRTRQSYYYEEEGHLCMQFLIKQQDA